MNANQEPAVTLALQYLRESKADDHGPGPADAWTKQDWDLWQKANPLVRQMTEMSLRILSGEVQMGEYAEKLLNGDTPYSVEKGASAIIENAIHRRGFFASKAMRTWRAIRE